MFLQLLQFSFTSHLILQACRQCANELAGLSMELCHLQHWSEGASSEELLLWMRSQHQGRVSSPCPGEYLHQLLPMYMCFIAGKSVPPHSCFTGLVSSGGAHPAHQGGAPVARSPPHARACASGRDNRGGDPW